MSEATFNDIGRRSVAEQGAEMGQMFGKPCIKFGKKAFAAFQNEAMIFKLGKETVSELVGKYPGSENWDPSGKDRPMKDWLQVPSEFSDDWNTLAEQALEYIQGGSGIKQ